MKALKMKLIGLGCLVLLTGGLVACNSEENSSEDEVSNVMENSENDDADNEFNKGEIKSSIEEVILDDVKGKSYTVDMLTPTNGEGFIASIQVDKSR